GGRGRPRPRQPVREAAHRSATSGPARRWRAVPHGPRREARAASARRSTTLLVSRGQPAAEQERTLPHQVEYLLLNLDELFARATQRAEELPLLREDRVGNKSADLEQAGHAARGELLLRVRLVVGSALDDKPAHA